MNNRWRTVASISIVCLLALSIQCARKADQEKNVVAIIGSDTLTAATIVSEEPDTNGSGTRMSLIVLTRVLAAQAALSADTAAVSTTIAELTDQLALRSGRSWNKKSSRNLYNAATVLAARIALTSSAGNCKAYAESLYAANAQAAPALVIGPCSDSSVFKPAYIKLNINNTLAKTLSWLLRVDQISAALIAGFVIDDANGVQPKNDMSKMVKGLIGKPEAATPTPSPAQLQKAQAAIDNSKLALKFRPQDKITATISKRMPELEALYKRHLKMHEAMQGTVWATFTVHPNGTVKEVALRSSQISERAFLEVLQKELLTFSFTTIPETVGDMIFEFPLQFAPQ